MISIGRTPNIPVADRIMPSSAPLHIILTRHIKIQGIDPEFKDDLIEKFTLPNPKWLENERMGRWNRGVPKELKYYSKSGKDGLVIPRGYARQLICLCRKNNLDYDIIDQRRNLEPVDVTFSGRLKPLQKEAAGVMLSKEFGTLSAPTGSGKTVIALYMIAQRKQPALIVVHTKDLAFQWMDRIETFLQIPKKEIGFIGAGKRSVGKKITVAMVQSLYKCVEEVAPHIGHVVVDECHRTPSRTFTEAVSGFDSRYMLGLSATPWRRDKLSKLIFWHLGDQHYEMSKTDLIERGDVLSAEVIIRETDFRPYYDPVNEYSKMLLELTANDERNRLIADDVAQEVASRSGTCLVLSDRKLQCETLSALLRYKHHIETAVLTGDVGTADRRSITERLNRGEIKVLVATGQLIGEGFDSKNLSTLFLATPVRFSGRLLQYLGRILRPAPGKDKARVFDYVDVNVEVLKAAANARQRVYDTDISCES